MTKNHFEFKLLILNSTLFFDQFALNKHNFLISTSIYALFEALDSWFPKKCNTTCLKWTSEKCHLKFKVHVATRFWVLNFHANLMNLASCLISHVCVPSFLLHNGHYLSLKLMISLSCLSSSSISLDSLISSFNSFLIFQNLKWFNLHPFLPLNLI